MTNPCAMTKLFSAKHDAFGRRICTNEVFMDKIIINGGNTLRGEVAISGMKNAALPIVFACILTKSKCVIENIPLISDVALAIEIIEAMGGKIKYLDGSTVEIDTADVKGGIAPDSLVSKMRASTYLIGAELGRFGYSKIGLPGGCNFGSRPIDQHIKGFRALGADVVINDDKIVASTPNGVHSGSIYFDINSVGATINVMMAAVLAPGITIIENAACEPHIVDLANFFNTCGAKITGAGTNVIKVRGVEELHGCTYEIIPDMIEAGTFMTAVAATSGSIKISNIIPKHLESITAKLRDMGVVVNEFDDYLEVTAGKALKPTHIQTKPYPGFPTDMHPQFTALLCKADGESTVTENIFNNRFKYIDELAKMGADIDVDGRVARIHGGRELCGAEVVSVDLRAGAALIVAGLAASGTTTVTNIELIKRGYEDIVEKFRSLGADISEISED